MSLAAGQILIEEGGLFDLDAVMQVMGDSFDPAFGEAWTAPQCAGLLPMPGVWLSLARRGGTVAGFALSRVIAGEAELLLLAVKRESQRFGVGRKLLEQFIVSAQRRGAEQLHLEVREGNHAVTLYTEAGFREVGRRKNYYNGRDGKLYDALTLARQAGS
ncbi:MAG: ribosomal protein S18-alanine N-acetyltransferase [Alphaproteobacteria bacterium]|nr:ribosomal protein S18-alanine N-acetyltransferase [Alphaproteobacteria bacterium]MBV9373178.1 ribosomal protein S18-alanine N-acetyltransferase [Alphaproteobacteria bacterium]MBV9900267.1 ribosomal protein S18-alanine N-acetyltransferase [Alphaproteobacteria bacterium]